jgi:hypothetical protein
MTPEEELRRLNRLIHQYQTVYRTTPDPDQRERVEHQLKDLQGYRDKILAVNVIDTREVQEQAEEGDELAPYPLLAALLAENQRQPAGWGVAPFAARDAAPTSAQKEIFYIALYALHFEREYLPFLTEKQLKLDFGFSMDRDAFYNSYQALGRRIENYRQENRRILDGMVSRDMELEVRKRCIKLARVIAVEAARFFRAIGRFCDELAEDAHGDEVKCLNCEGEIFFDSIEGRRTLQGQSVTTALAMLSELAREVIAYLNIPELETQESERADRY